MIGNSSKCLIIYITPSPNVCLGKPKLLAQPLVMGIHLFDFTLWLTLVHSGSLSGPQRHPLYIAEAPPSGHENLSRQWQIQHTAESKWQIQHTTTITFTQPLDLWLLQENPSTLNTSGWLIVWSQIGSLWPACLPPWPKHEQIHFSFAPSPLSLQPHLYCPPVSSQSQECQDSTVLILLLPVHS